MKYCSHCGSGLDFRIPAGDTLPRHVCDACGTIHYLNPKLVVGAIAEWNDRILLCRRAIEPRHGYWTLPAGFMENRESTADAAVRETLEEACARISIGEMFTLINVPHISQVHVVYRARLLDLDFAPGEESLEVALFAEEEIPWDRIAFRTISLTLQHYFADRRAGCFGFHTCDLGPPPSGADPFSQTGKPSASLRG
ncbi:MAG TPA: NUDIX hydrolase [Azoarcus taiwanensis]|nr:NUDIX hydrolase [Azoarcus taiwanensis]